MKQLAVENLIGSVLRMIKLEELFSKRSGQDQIGLDIHILSGQIAIRQKIILRGPAQQAEIEILGIETVRDPNDSRTVRIHCTRPVEFDIPEGKLEGWQIRGELTGGASAN